MAHGDSLLRVTEALREAGCTSRDQKNWTCPAHPDRTPSLGVRHENERTLLRCHANCDIKDILAAIGLDFRDLFDDNAPHMPGIPQREWSYSDPSGGLIGTVVRLGPDKSFRPMHINGNQRWELGAPEAMKTTPYALSGVLDAIAAGLPVFVVEGERDADTLRAMGLAATCNWGGAGKWTDEHSRYLVGAKRVNVIRDNDTAGLQHAEAIVASLSAVVDEIHLLCPMEGVKDVTELFSGEMEGIGFDGLLTERVVLREADPLAAEWKPMDLSAFADGTAEVPLPTMLLRDDDKALLYEGMVHWISGEPESGKTWVALLAVRETLLREGTVLYIDHEDQPNGVVGRLLALGVPKEAIVERFHYMSPEVPWMRAAENYAALLKTRYHLCVIDGVTGGLGLEGKSISDNDDVSKWIIAMPRAIARSTGAAVICCDHVTKSKDTQGRWSIGAMAKLAAVDGASYIASIGDAPLGRGLTGHVELRVAKDRPGGVRPHCGAYQAADRTQYAALFTFDATDPEAIEVFVASEPIKKETPVFRPTGIMEQISRMIEEADDGMVTQQIKDGISGRASVTLDALNRLVVEGHVEKRVGHRAGSYRYYWISDYREHTDVWSESQL